MKQCLVGKIRKTFPFSAVLECILWFIKLQQKDWLSDRRLENHLGFGCNQLCGDVWNCALCMYFGHGKDFFFTNHAHVFVFDSIHFFSSFFPHNFRYDSVNTNPVHCFLSVLYILHYSTQVWKFDLWGWRLVKNKNPWLFLYHSATSTNWELCTNQEFWGGGQFCMISLTC